MENGLKFVNPNKNDYFSYLRGVDLQSLIIDVENFFLDYRQTLNLPTNLSFGIELEYEGVSTTDVGNYVYRNVAS